MEISFSDDMPIFFACIGKIDLHVEQSERYNVLERLRASVLCLYFAVVLSVFSEQQGK